MKQYYTEVGIELTEEQCKCVASFERLMKKWDGAIRINAIAGVLTLMLDGDTEQNPTPEMSSTGGFNADNVISHKYFGNVKSDGGDW